LPVGSDEHILLVPRRFVILRQMTFPSDDHEEVRDMIGLRLINNIPYPVEDIIYHHQHLEKDGEGLNRVLVVIIEKEVSQRYCRFLQRAGIKDGKLALSSFGISEWLAYQEKIHKISRGRPTVLINIDTRHCEICFCQNRNLFFSRSLPYGREYLASGETRDLADQVQLSLSAYQKERLGPQPEKILILSTQKEGEALKERLSGEWSGKIKVLMPLHGTPGLSSSKDSAPQLRKTCALTAGLGLILSNTSHMMNLAPVEVHQAKQKREQKHRLVKFICLMLMAAVLGVSGQFIDIHKNRTALKALKRTIENLKPQVEEARGKIQFVQAFDRRLEGSKFIPDVIEELTRLTPEEVSFRTLSLGKNGDLTIEGYAKSNAGVNDLQARLIRSPGFHNVDLKFSTKRRVANMAVMDFRIASQLGSSEGDPL
jgi:Tfp pilus assembly protein PilN